MAYKYDVTSVIDRRTIAGSAGEVFYSEPFPANAGVSLGDCADAWFATRVYAYDGPAPPTLQFSIEESLAGVEWAPNSAYHANGSPDPTKTALTTYHVAGKLPDFVRLRVEKLTDGPVSFDVRVCGK